MIYSVFALLFFWLLRNSRGFIINAGSVYDSGGTATINKKSLVARGGRLYTHRDLAYNLLAAIPGIFIKCGRALTRNSENSTISGSVPPIVCDRLEGFNMITVKSPDEIKKMRIAGRLAAQVLEVVSKIIAPGITTTEIDRFREESIRHLAQFTRN